MKKNSEKPEVSIIIPTYNSGDVINECLEKIYGQNYPSFEVIIVDNYSSDDTVKKAKKFKVKMKIIQQKCNPALARNIGVINSKGKYVLFLDSDQAVSQNLIEECVKKCEKDETGMIIIPEVYVGKNFWACCSAAWKNCYSETEKNCDDNWHIETYRPRFFLKEHIIRVGMFNSTLLWGEDCDLYNRLKRIKIKEKWCESKIYHYEPTSVTKLLIKNLRYGGSMPIFMQQTKKHIFLLLVRRTFLTLKEVIKRFKKSPSIIIGCIILLCLKIYFINLGLFMGLASRVKSKKKQANSTEKVAVNENCSSLKG